jgi:hypothetical protein
VRQHCPRRDDETNIYINMDDSWEAQEAADAAEYERLKAAADAELASEDAAAAQAAASKTAKREAQRAAALAAAADDNNDFDITGGDTTAPTIKEKQPVTATAAPTTTAAKPAPRSISSSRRSSNNTTPSQSGKENAPSATKTTTKTTTTTATKKMRRPATAPASTALMSKAERLDASRVAAKRRIRAQQQAQAADANAALLKQRACLERIESRKSMAQEGRHSAALRVAERRKQATAAAAVKAAEKKGFWDDDDDDADKDADDGGEFQCFQQRGATKGRVDLETTRRIRAHRAAAPLSPRSAMRRRLLEERKMRAVRDKKERGKLSSKLATTKTMQLKPLTTTRPLTATTRPSKTKATTGSRSRVRVPRVARVNTITSTTNTPRDGGGDDIDGVGVILTRMHARALRTTAPAVARSGYGVDAGDDGDSAFAPKPGRCNHLFSLLSIIIHFTL